MARRVLGDTYGLTLRMSWIHAKGLIRNEGATLDHLHEAVNTLEEIEPSARRVFGGAEPLTMVIERDLQNARTALAYSECLKDFGEGHANTLVSAHNYASCLLDLHRVKDARSLLHKTVPVARRVLGENDYLTFGLRFMYAKALYQDDSATLDDLREAVTTFEDTARTARRVFGSAHPTTEGIQEGLRLARAALRARETPLEGRA